MDEVIVGVDGSEGSLKAARLAAELATATRKKLVLACVQARIPEVPEWTPPPEWHEIVRGQAERSLAAVADALKQPNVERIVLQGHPAEALTEAGEKRHASMLVVGSRGRGAVK